MGRPRTLGPTITMRLPVELHALAAERAAQNGQSVNEYLAARLIDALRRQHISLAHPSAARDVTPNWKAATKK